MTKNVTTTPGQPAPSKNHFLRHGSMTTINTKLRRFATQFQCSVIALVLLNVCPRAPWRKMATRTRQRHNNTK